MGISRPEPPFRRQPQPQPRQLDTRLAPQCRSTAGRIVIWDVDQAKAILIAAIASRCFLVTPLTPSKAFRARASKSRRALPSSFALGVIAASAVSAVSALPSFLYL